MRLRALADAGDHGGARRLAAELLADPGASDADREVATRIRALTAPDRVVVAAGLTAVVVAIAVTAWLVAH